MSMEDNFEKSAREKDTATLEELADYYFKQHAAARDGRKARGGVGTDNMDDELMREYMKKLRVIDKILLEREE